MIKFYLFEKNVEIQFWNGLKKKPVSIENCIVESKHEVENIESKRMEQHSDKFKMLNAFTGFHFTLSFYVHIALEQH